MSERNFEGKVFLEQTAKGIVTWLKAIDDGHVRGEKMTVILQHEIDTTTAPRNHAHETRFIAGPILGDAPSTHGIVGHHRGKYHVDQAERRGAILEFEWSGPVSADALYSFLPERNVCYDQYPQGIYLRRQLTQTSSPCRAYTTGRLV